MIKKIKYYCQLQTTSSFGNKKHAQGQESISVILFEINKVSQSQTFTEIQINVLNII